MWILLKQVSSDELRCHTPIFLSQESQHVVPGVCLEPSTTSAYFAFHIDGQVCPMVELCTQSSSCKCSGVLTSSYISLHFFNHWKHVIMWSQRQVSKILASMMKESINHQRPDYYLMKWSEEKKTFCFVSQVRHAALAHYKLVFIHPFLDGNGRTSR